MFGYLFEIYCKRKKKGINIIDPGHPSKKIVQSFMNKTKKLELDNIWNGVSHWFGPFKLCAETISWRKTGETRKIKEKSGAKVSSSNHLNERETFTLRGVWIMQTAKNKNASAGLHLMSYE